MVGPAQTHVAVKHVTDIIETTPIVVSNKFYRSIVDKGTVKDAVARARP